MRRRPERSRKAKSAEKLSPAAKDAAFLQLARQRFKAIQDYEKDQRERELEDIRFYDGDQWPGEIQTGRQGQAANGNLPAVPSRPMITINKSREPVQQVLNQERQSDLGVSLVPADDFGGLSEPVSDDEITLREGLVRRIQRTSDAAAARTWAFERAVIAGRGYYGVMLKYGEGKTRDQEVYVRRFYNQAAVSLGPHEEPDGSDADYGFVGTYIPWNDYEAEYPHAIDGEKNALITAAADDDAFKALGEDYPDWFGTEGTGKNATRMCRVVEYWYTEITSRKLVFLSDGRDVWESELTDADEALMTDPETGEEIGNRLVPQRTIKFAKIDAMQVLERTDWSGRYIPIVKVLGEELQPYDEQRRSEGMVRPGMQAGRGFNYMVSKLVEQVGLTPIPPIIVDPESIEPYMDWWKLAATRALFMLPQLTRDEQGREYREAHRPGVDPNLQPLAMSIGMFDQFIQSTMRVHDPSTGKVDPRLKSGKAIESVVAQDAQGTSNFIANLQRSVHYEGRIENDLLYPVYGARPGRIAKILDPKGDGHSVMLNQPFTMQQGKPRPAMMPHPENPGQNVPMPMGHPGMPPEAKTYSLTKDAQLNVAVKVSKNSDLRRDQLASVLGEFVTANPQEMAVYGDLLWKTLDVPEHEVLAERARLMLAPPIQQALKAKVDGSNLPPEIASQLAQKDGQIQHAEQAMQQLDGMYKQEKAGHQAMLDKTKMETDSRERIAAADREYEANEKAKDRAAKIEEARISAAKQSADLAAEAREEAFALGSSQVHEAGMAAAAAGHEQAMAGQAHQQTIAQDAHAGMVDASLADQAQGHALEQGQQAAALAPEPAAPAGA